MTNKGQGQGQSGDTKTDVPTIIEEDEEDDEEEDEGPTLKKQFVLFIKFRNPDDKGTHIVLSESDYWMRQAKVIEGRKLTHTDTGVCFFKFKKYKLNFEEYLEFLQVLATYKKISLEEMINKMTNCGSPAEDEGKKGGAMGTKL